MALTMAEREVQYCTAEDGVRIAFCVEGTGPPVVVLPQLLESFSLHEVFPAFQKFMGALARGRMVVRFDFRGTGLSDRSADELGLEGGYRDLKAVIEAVGVETCELIALTSGGPTAIAYAARHPERVSALVLYGTYARHADLWSRDFSESYSKLALERWDMAARVIAGLSGEDTPESMVRHEELLRKSMTGETMSNMFMAQFETADVSGILSDVKARTLVLHRSDDAAIPMVNARKLAAGIPGARLVLLQGRINNPAAGDSEAVVRAIDEFLADRPGTGGRGPREAAGAFRAILFTDLVGHTEMMSRLGDEKGREVLREHERITREVLAAHGGTEVKTMGDGFMASFGGVTKAVECAVALQKEIGNRKWEIGEELSVRCGLNAGEPIEEDGDLFGATVILASRIAAKAEGGEILVSDTVRGLCSGKGFLFSDRGEFEAKGFEEPVRVYEVRWRDG
jgi:class 3 adenylate cyclase